MKNRKHTAIHGWLALSLGAALAAAAGAATLTISPATTSNTYGNPAAISPLPSLRATAPFPPPSPRLTGGPKSMRIA